MLHTINGFARTGVHSTLYTDSTWASLFYSFSLQLCLLLFYHYHAGGIEFSEINTIISVSLFFLINFHVNRISGFSLGT